MHKILKKVSITFIVLNIFLCSLLFISTVRTETFQRTSFHEDYTTISEQIAYTNLSTGETGTYVPGESLESNYEDVVSFTFEVSGHEDEYISFYTSYLKVDVFVDGSLVYSYGDEGSIPSYMTSPPSKWHQVPLNSNETQQVEIQITNLNNRFDLTIDNLGVGTQAGIFTHILSEDVFDFLVSITFIIMSLVLFGIYIFSLLRKVHDKNIGLLCLFTFNIGVYFITQSLLFEAYFSTPGFAYLIGYVSFYLLPISFLMLCLATINTDKNKLLMHITLLGGVIILFSLTLLQAIGVLDYYESLFVFYAFVIVTLISSCLSLYREHKEENGKRAYRLLTSSIVFGVFCLIQMIVYALIQSPAGLKLLKLGFIAFLFVLSYDAFSQFKEALTLKEKSEKLRKMAYVDPLTGFGNRNAFQVAIDNIHDYKGQLACVIYCDMNNLKTINDTLGHKYGDQALIEVALLIKEKFPNTTLFRIGGDEFVVVSYDTSEQSIKKFVDRINISKKTLKLDSGEVLDIKVSAGYCFFTFDENEDVEAVLETADKMMYENKIKAKGLQ